jgi:hypothetical protein
MRKIKLFEIILSTGYNLSVIPLTYIIRIGYVGKVLCIVFLVVYSMPVLIIHDVFEDEKDVKIYEVDNIKLI